MSEASTTADTKTGDGGDGYDSIVVSEVAEGSLTLGSPNSGKGEDTEPPSPIAPSSPLDLGGLEKDIWPIHDLRAFT